MSHNVYIFRLFETIVSFIRNSMTGRAIHILADIDLYILVFLISVYKILCLFKCLQISFNT